MSQGAAGGGGRGPPHPPLQLTRSFHPLPPAAQLLGLVLAAKLKGRQVDPGESGGFRSPPVALESEHWLQLNRLGPRRRGAGKGLGSRHPWQVPWETTQKASPGYW